MKKKVIQVNGISVTIVESDFENYISLTDMANAKEDVIRAADVIKNWLRTRTTLEFLGTWEVLYNPDFKVVEFDHFKKEAGLPTFVLSASQWIETTNAKGIYVKKGKYGGTYAHKDIAFEFASAISPVFKLYLIKEFQRLIENEYNRNQIEWDTKRFLSKNNYLIHTNAIKEYVIPKCGQNIKDWLIYASEADLLNMAIFKCTAKEWRDANPQLAIKSNIRDYASINELTVISNLETHNAQFIKEGKGKEERYQLLCEIAGYQLSVLNEADDVKQITKE